MKKNQTNTVDEDMLPEYNFEGKEGVRGTYYRAYREGHHVQIHREDGTTITQHFTLADGAVILEPDVREFFPSSESVNKALRSLIELAPKGRAKRPTRASKR